MSNFTLNPVSLILIVPVLITFVCALFTPFSRERVINGFYSIVNNMEFIVALILVLYITKGVLFDRNTPVFRKIYELLPVTIKDSLQTNNLYTYLSVAFITLLIAIIVIRIITYPFYKYVFEGMANALYRTVNSLGTFTKRIISLLCSIPRALVTVICISFVFYFFSYYFTVPGLSRWIDESKALSAVYDTALKPVVDADIAKKIPVIINDQFSGRLANEKEQWLAENIRDTLGSYNIKVIQYFNGVTLDEAIKSTDEIDRLALELTQDAEGDYDKGKKIYQWITKNIRYDYEKAKQIAVKTEGIESGTISCYQTKQGICFDYASLFASMLKANHIRVRMITGLGYSGLYWGDHAWNQFYDSGSKRWVNVDCTFGVSGDYFDSARFSLDHKNERAQGEW